MKRRQHKENYELFCETLKSLRRSTNVTQQELAEKLGKPQSFVSKYESGERRLDVVELLAILDALGLTFSQFSSKFQPLQKRIK